MIITTLQDYFDTASLANLEGNGLFQQAGEVLWQYHGRTFDLRNGEVMLAQREQACRQGDYTLTKFINRILAQLDYTRKNDRVYHYPQLLQIEHTDICNARCIMCNHFFTRNHGCKFMDFSMIQRLEPYLPYVENIVLNGIGEPLLHPRIMELISIYDKYGIKMTTNTNLSIMTPELASLMHRTFTDIQVSCDAASPETYSAIRQGLNFDRFVKNLKMLRVAGKTEICMATVVMRQNFKELPQIVELAADLGCDKLVMLDLNTSALMQTTGDSLTRFPTVAAPYMEQAREMAEKKHIHIHTLEYIDTLKDPGREQEELEHLRKADAARNPNLEQELYRLYEQIDFMNPIFPAEQTDYCTASRYHVQGYCEFVESRPFISADGDVFNCCTRRMHSMGNLKEKSLGEIWNGLPMRLVRHVFNRSHLPKYCVGCSYYLGQLMSQRMQVTNVDRDFYVTPYDQLRMELIEQKMQH